MYKITFYLSILAIIFISCKNEQQKTNSQIIAESKLHIVKTNYGNLVGKQAVDLYTLKNEKGMVVKITNYGGIITSWTAPDKDGKYEDIVLGFDSLNQYVKNSPYFGAIIGRYGNRIAKGKFSIDGKEYKLATNNIGNHLHGGLTGFDKVLWTAEAIDSAEPKLILKYTSKDGEEGYPGNLNSTVTYTLKNDNSLTMDFEATSDKNTIVNLCNHSYYNLSGYKSDILNHILTLHAEKYLPVDKTLIPNSGLKPVSGTVFDFTKPTIIGKGIDDVKDEQIKFGLGYDHCWALNNQNGKMALAASVSDPSSGRTMEIYTTEPGIQFYSGNFLDGTINGKRNFNYPKRFGFCLETQHYPDSPNQQSFPSVLLKAGEVYKSSTIHKFQ